METTINEKELKDIRTALNVIDDQRAIINNILNHQSNTINKYEEIWKNTREYCKQNECSKCKYGSLNSRGKIICITALNIDMVINQCENAILDFTDWREQTLNPMRIIEHINKQVTGNSTNNQD